MNSISPFALGYQATPKSSYRKETSHICAIVGPSWSITLRATLWLLIGFSQFTPLLRSMIDLATYGHPKITKAIGKIKLPVSNCRLRYTPIHGTACGLRYCVLRENGCGSLKSSRIDWTKLPWRWAFCELSVRRLLEHVSCDRTSGYQLVC
jgi:hypothetical protein